MSQNYFVKVSNSSLKEAADIMQAVYEEEPKHWPHGLSVDGMDGGLYLIRKSASSEPVGFVGWQDRWEGLRKIGYYSIGIKKEHRRQGFAKKAVSQLIGIKAGSVDEVRAYIVDSNKASMNLADKLEVPVELEKSASVFRTLGRLGATGAGMAGAGAAGYGLANLENKYLGLGERTSKINNILGTITGLISAGLLARKGGGGKLVDVAKYGLGPLTMKQLGVVGTDAGLKYMDSQQELVDTKLDTAKKQQESANIEKGTADTYSSLAKRLGGPALLGGGLLGLAAVIAMFRNRGSGRGGPGVLSVDIPEQQMSEKFYKTLSRDLLFDSPKEKKRKLQMLLANSGNDPMIRKMLAEKSASFKKKSDFVKEAAMPLLQAGGRFILNRGLPALKNVFKSKAAPALKNYGRNLGTASLNTGKGIIGLQGGNRAGRAIRNSALINTGLNAGLTGLDSVTGWDTAGSHRDMLFTPFRDAYTNFQQGNIGRGLFNSALAPINLTMGLGMGGSLARLGRYGGSKILGRNMANRVGLGESGRLAQTINSAQSIGQHAGSGLTRLVGLDPTKRLGGTLAAGLGFGLTSPWEFFGKGQALRGITNQYGRVLGGRLGKGVSDFGRGTLPFHQAKFLANPLARDSRGVLNAGNQVAKALDFTGKAALGFIPSYYLGNRLGASAYRPAQGGLDESDPLNLRFGKGTEAFNNTLSEVKKVSPALAAIMGTGATFIPGMTMGNTNFGTQNEGGSTIHFGTDDSVGLAGSFLPDDPAANPALVAFLTDIDNWEQGLLQEKPLAANYAPTEQGFEQWKADAANPFNQMGVAGTISSLMGMNPLADKAPTEASRQFDNRVWQAFRERKAGKADLTRNPVMSPNIEFMLRQLRGM